MCFSLHSLVCLVSVALYPAVVLSRHHVREQTTLPASFTMKCGRVTKPRPAGYTQRGRWQPSFRAGRPAPFACSSVSWDWNVPAPLRIFKTSRALPSGWLRREQTGEVSGEFLVQSPSAHPGCQAPAGYLERKAFLPYLRHWYFGASLSQTHT